MKDKRNENQQRTRLRRLLKRQAADEIRLTPGFQTHDQLWKITKTMPTDFAPYGQTKRDDFGDCSCGCRWYHILAGEAGNDWGVCANPGSPRAGLLTFEHQGCPQYERDSRLDYRESARGRKKLERFAEAEEELRQWHRSHALPNWFSSTE